MSKCACCDETESLPLPPSLPPPFTASLATVRCDIMQLSPWRSLGDGPSLDNVNSLHLSLSVDLIPGLRVAVSQSRWTTPIRLHQNLKSEIQGQDFFNSTPSEKLCGC